MQCTNCKQYVHVELECCNNCGFSDKFTEFNIKDEVIEHTEYSWSMPNEVIDKSQSVEN